MRSRKDLGLKTSLGCAILIAGLLVFAAPEAHAGPWPEHMAKITKLKGQTEELENDIKHMIEEKREADDEKKVRALTLEIAEKYKALSEASTKLEEEMNHVRFKHPEQAEQLDRKYVRFQTKTLKDLENEVGLDGKLDRIRHHVQQTFPTPQPEQKSAESQEAKVSPYLRRPASLDEDTDVPEKVLLKK